MPIWSSSKEANNRPNEVAAPGRRLGASMRDAKMTGTAGGVFPLRGAGLVCCGVLALVLVLGGSTWSLAMDHAELSQILKAIPPNGPFWKYGNVVMRTRTRKAEVAPVVFAHWSHRARYTCRVCHQELGISMRAGDTGITRSQYLAGKYCGACHNGQIAFSVADGPKPQCKRCHLENTRALEQQFADFSAELPLAPFGNGIDWAQALKSGRIRPTNVIDASSSALKLPEKLTRPLKLGTSSPRSDVGFSHQEHFEELDCSSCHPDIFNIKKKTTQSFTMDSNIYGNFCGSCHMLVAFPMNDCRRCHKSMSNSAY
jgi:c(7)-type cytochrome triheme protein